VFSALLDTSVLWPSLQRDFLLALAIEGLYRPLWSIAILAELEFHETQKLIARGEVAEAATTRAVRLVEQMSAAFDDALVENWEPLEGSFGLPDRDDEHVVAAALVGGADVIVTSNLKDFPPQLIPHPVVVTSPAEFAADTVAVSPDTAHRAIQSMVARFSSPPMTPDQVLDRLIERYGMLEAVDLLRAVN
jgi:hypothetical protein